jgi:type I restriction-modification system DNA methylase subunit
MNLRNKITLLFLFFTIICTNAQQKKFSVHTVAFYNLENLFDTINNPNFDEEWLPNGAQNWTSEKYSKKLENLARVLSEIGTGENPNSPTLIGGSEIENRGVLEDLVKQPKLAVNDYGIVHYDSPDKRGIDVALLYQKKHFKPTSSVNIPLLIYRNDSKIVEKNTGETAEDKADSDKNEVSIDNRVYTRDVLLVTGMLDGDEVNVIVNHWPSRSGGEKKSSPFREAAGRLNRKIMDSIYKINPNAKVVMYGQEVNDKTWAVAQADLLLKGETAYITKGDTLCEDGAAGEQFDFMLSNPPYGKSWKKTQKKVMNASNGRFDVGQPRSSDGQLLFTLHMISKMKPAELGGSAIAIVHNGSPLFSGDAGSGESEIRKYVLENDWLETIVALPTELFYNTGIATYIWLIRNNKPAKRKGKIQLINAVDFWKPMKRSLGNKRRRIHNGIEGSGENERYVEANDQIKQIIDIHKSFKEGQYSKIFELEDFAFRKVFLDLEETDENGNPITIEKEVTVAQNKLDEILVVKTADDKKRLTELKDKKGKEGEFTFTLNTESELAIKNKTADTSITIRKTLNGNKLGLKATINIPKIIKDNEYIPWKEDKEAFLKKEVEKKWTITAEEKGYEIPFTKHFYVYQPLREQAKVVNEMAELEKENLNLMLELGITL